MSERTHGESPGLEAMTADYVTDLLRPSAARLPLAKRRRLGLEWSSIQPPGNRPEIAALSSPADAAR